MKRLPLYSLLALAFGVWLSLCWKYAPTVGEKIDNILR